MHKHTQHNDYFHLNKTINDRNLSWHIQHLTQMPSATLENRQKASERDAKRTQHDRKNRHRLFTFSIQTMCKTFASKIHCCKFQNAISIIALSVFFVLFCLSSITINHQPNIAWFYAMKFRHRRIPFHHFGMEHKSKAWERHKKNE